MSFVITYPSIDRLANEQNSRMTKFVDGLVELTKGLFVNLEQDWNRIVFFHVNLPRHVFFDS
jgi:hypothetical protein